MKRTQGIDEQRGLSITEMAEHVHGNSVRKGFWDSDGSTKGYNVAEKLALIHSEVSEALEADRKNDYRALNIFTARWNEVRNSLPDGATDEFVNTEYARLYKEYVKDSFGGELAGTIIRCLDLAAKLKIDIEGHLIAEANYNTTRPFKHGKLY